MDHTYISPARSSIALSKPPQGHRRGGCKHYTALMPLKDANLIRFEIELRELPLALRPRQHLKVNSIGGPLVQNGLQPVSRAAAKHNVDKDCLGAALRIPSNEPPPLRKHGQGQENNGHTGSLCLDKPVLARDAQHKETLHTETLPVPHTKHITHKHGTRTQRVGKIQHVLMYFK